jgi:hypothetical protein
MVRVAHCMESEETTMISNVSNFQELRMGLVVNQKAKTTLEKIVPDGLSAVLVPGTLRERQDDFQSDCDNQQPLQWMTWSSTLQFIECARSPRAGRQRSSIATEDAARLSGFSRPVIISLLDSKANPGKVTKTPKGHRRLERSEFVAWLETVDTPKDLPKTLQDARSGSRDEEPKRSRVSRANREAQQSERAKRLETARSMGLF